MPRSSNLADLTDSELIARCLDGGGDAWDALIDRYARLVYAVPLQMGLDRSEADDVAQETFVTLLGKLQAVRDRERIGLWLAVTARRKSLDLRTRGPAARESAMDDDAVIADPTPGVGDLLAQLEEEALVHQAVDDLSDRCRAIVRALYLDDPPLSYKATAKKLGIPMGSLGPTRRRCLDKLRGRLEVLLG